MRIISIDPGYERLGIAILEKLSKQKEVLIFSECFKTSAKLPHHERLTLIGNKIKEIIKKYKPEALATEKLFFSGNQKTAMLVAEARGVILYAGSSLGLEVFEYTPNSVKMAITGYGRSEKKQMIDMVKKLISINYGGINYGGNASVVNESNSDDEFDAIAIGLTHFAIHR
ncbi:MAG: crossover junction endodeoxyribonuclease RuvC [Candidatus Zambryskibacteria bacterium]|nr:crossover junction endodeoxyribonuclease RuvC [Candidatus Zambryskibacteria bacterium]